MSVRNQHGGAEWAHWAQRIILSLVGVALVGCRLRDRLRQVETMSNVSSVVSNIEQVRRAKGDLTDQEAQVLISQSPLGHDAWGHPLFYAAKMEGRTQHYVVVATGSDGKLDFSDVGKYFDLKPEDIRGQPARDIVFRDGKVVTNAGN